ATLSSATLSSATLSSATLRSRLSGRSGWNCVLVAFGLTLSSCVTMPETYAPPIQRDPIENARPYRIQRVIAMGEPDAEAFLVKDIARGTAEGGAWRWTQKRPTVRVVLKGAEKQKLVVDYTIPDATFAQTGPVTLDFYVNDQKLDTVRIVKAGQQHFEKPVPMEWLKANAENLLAVEIDKMYVSPQDQSTLGFVLTRMGLSQ
ncbi:MAG: hypothetical protein ABI823_01240, partial [Bryobacteraceae bacterium]